MVAYRVFFFIFTGGSNCKALTGKILVFWMGGRLREVVAYERRRFDCTKSFFHDSPQHKVPELLYPLLLPLTIPLDFPVHAVHQ